MRLLRIGLGLVLGIAILWSAGCTLGLVHTRESTSASLYFRSAADSGNQSRTTHDQRSDLFHAMRNDSAISSALVLITRGHHVEVVTIDGAFPKWSDSATFFLIGAGALEQHDGKSWRVYRFPDTVRSKFRRYTAGIVRIAADQSEVILELTPASRYSGPGYADFSGRRKIDSVEGSPAQPDGDIASPRSGL